jgi:hypothetical protein
MGKREFKKKPIARRRCMWEYNIKMDCRELKWDGIDWINLLQVKIYGGLF